jgi:hypothetical protein
LFLEHDFRRFDYSRDGVAYLELHFFGASPSDYTFDEVSADAYHNVRHHAAELEFRNFAF